MVVCAPAVGQGVSSSTLQVLDESNPPADICLESRLTCTCLCMARCVGHKQCSLTSLVGMNAQYMAEQDQTESDGL